MNSNLKSLLIWILLAYGLCLLPGGCFSWLLSCLPGGTGGASSSGMGDLVEWVAHAILIGGVGYSMARIFLLRMEWLLSLFITVCLVALIAASIEWFQGLLPESFHRGFSKSDIWASLMGGLMGAALGILMEKKCKSAS